MKRPVFMERSATSRVGARLSPDIVQLETRRRLRPLEAMNKPRSWSSTNHRFSSQSILPIPKNDRTNTTRVKEALRGDPPANFNDYTHRRSRRIYNKTVNDYPLAFPISVKKEEDPMTQLKHFSNFRLDRRDLKSKEMYMACLGLKLIGGSNLSSLMADEESNRVEEISFEELLDDGYMIYPHDLLNSFTDHKSIAHRISVGVS